MMGYLCKVVLFSVARHKIRKLCTVKTLDENGLLSSLRALSELNRDS